MSERDSNEDSKKEYEQRGNIILRQEMRNLTPICNVKFAIICNALLGVLFFIFGVPIIASKGKIVEFSYDYTTECDKKKCNISLTIQDLIPAPVYVYYELTNFYSNHRDYVKSKIWSQLRGETHIDSKNNSKCEGAKLMKEVMDGDSSRYKTYKGFPLSGNDFANPCGLVAKAFFNDSYTLTEKNDGKSSVVEIKSDGIANEYDKKHVFKRINDSEKVQWIDVEDGRIIFVLHLERFMVWMQMETFPHFRKLWGRIESGLQGNYNLEIINSKIEFCFSSSIIISLLFIFDSFYRIDYDAKSFNGTKKIIFSNSTSLGNSSSIGFFLVFGGVFCILVILVILFLKSRKSDTPIDFTELKWE